MEEQLESQLGTSTAGIKFVRPVGLGAEHVAVKVPINGIELAADVALPLARRVLWFSLTGAAVAGEAPETGMWLIRPPLFPGNTPLTRLRQP
jgi:hypothetical protein